MRGEYGMIASIREEIAGALTTAEKEGLSSVLVEQCARQGYILLGEVRFDVQASLFKGCADVTATAYVSKARVRMNIDVKYSAA
jgi:hypothetical protein